MDCLVPFNLLSYDNDENKSKEGLCGQIQELEHWAVFSLAYNISSNIIHAIH